MSGLLTNKVAIVTGGAGGIGSRIAKAYANQGAKVVVADLNLDAAEQTVAELQENGAEALAVSMNVTSEKDVNDAIQQVINNL